MKTYDPNKMSFGQSLYKIFVTDPKAASAAATPSAMKKCSACGAEISALADACPRCGHPSQAKQLQSIGCVLFVIGLAIVLLFALLR